MLVLLLEEVYEEVHKDIPETFIFSWGEGKSILKEKMDVSGGTEDFVSLCCVHCA